MPPGEEIGYLDWRKFLVSGGLRRCSLSPHRFRAQAQQTAVGYIAGREHDPATRAYQMVSRGREFDVAVAETWRQKLQEHDLDGSLSQRDSQRNDCEQQEVGGLGAPCGSPHKAGDPCKRALVDLVHRARSVT